MGTKFLFLSTFCILLAACGPATSSAQTSSEMYHELLYANSVAWGLGTNISEYVTNDRDYEWYIDQYTTGSSWSTNCGPTSIEMAGLWANADFSYTAEDARASYRPSGGWWYDTDIQGALTQFSIPNQSSTISSSADLVGIIDAGGIALVNPDMSQVTGETNATARAGRFYSNVTGHYLIIKGYVIADSNTFFEVYDPWSVGVVYEDGTLKGKNRYYDAVSFTNSIMLWWPKVYTISPVSD